LETGVKIKQLRNKKGISLRKLAAIIDVDHSYLSRVENGKVTPSLETIVKIAQALECDVADFFERKMEVDEELKKEGVEWIIFGKQLEEEGITLDQVKEWVRAIKATKL